MEKNKIEFYTRKNLKIGLLGGTFDPPHIGHIHMAQCAMKHMKLDKIVFLICGNTPHKDDRDVSLPEHRLAMLELAIAGMENYHIDDSELYSNEKSYTINSILRIKRIMDRSSRLYFIIGADSLMYLEKWHDAENLMKNTSFICIPREGFKDSECLNKIESLEREYSAEIKYIDCSRLDAASVDIRHMVAEGQSIMGLVDSKVQKYIYDSGLYKYEI